jgi:hypothetical protein
VDRENGIAAVIRFEEKSLQFRLTEAFFKRRHGPGHLFADVFSFSGELGQDFNLVLLFLKEREKTDVALELLLPLLKGQRFFLIGPSFGSR